MADHVHEHKHGHTRRGFLQRAGLAAAAFVAGAAGLSAVKEASAAVGPPHNAYALKYNNTWWWYCQNYNEYSSLNYPTKAKAAAAANGHNTKNPSP